LGQVAPARSGPIDPEDGIDKEPIVYSVPPLITDSAAPQTLDVGLAHVKIRRVDVGDLQLAASRRLEAMSTTRAS
jgi:hypothetical protein